MNVLCLVPARAGSKGIAAKNLCSVGGASLVGRAVDCGHSWLAQADRISESAVLIDTDSAEIAEEAARWGAVAPFLRPTALAQDGTTTIDSTLAAIQSWQERFWTPDAIVLLQPTSPLRTAENVLACWRAFDPPVAPSVTTIAPDAHPRELALRRLRDGTLAWLCAPTGLRRQDYEPSFHLTGAAYICTPAFLRARSAFVADGETIGIITSESAALDIDTIDDLQRAEALAASAVPEPLRLARLSIGDGSSCFLIAEAGVNHNGSVELAHALIDVAADAGADAVKFQTFEPALVASDAAPKAAYQMQRTPERSQREMLSALVLSATAFRELAQHAAERGIVFLSTPFDERSLDLLETIGVAAYKVASGEVTNHRLLDAIAARNKPVLLSTGMSTLPEVSAAVRVVRRRNSQLALFHCVSQYPARAEDCNLKAIDTMRRFFRLPVGWSDHTAGLTVALAAAAAGADMIEKHFTTDRTLPGPDHAASLEPDELTALVQQVRCVASAMGDGIKLPVEAELDTRLVARRSLHLGRDMRAGEVLSAADLIALRPATGLSPAQASSVVGRRLRADLSKGSMLEPDDIE